MRDRQPNLGHTSSTARQKTSDSSGYCRAFVLCCLWQQTVALMVVGRDLAASPTRCPHRSSTHAQLRLSQTSPIPRRRPTPSIQTHTTPSSTHSDPTQGTSRQGQISYVYVTSYIEQAKKKRKQKQKKTRVG